MGGNNRSVLLLVSVSENSAFCVVTHATGITYYYVCVFTENHRVHFDENKDLVGKDNGISVEQKNGKLEVYLGFLQVNHRYSISLSVPITFCHSGDCGEIVLDSSTLKPYLRITSATVSQDMIDFQLELLAHKQNLLVEEFSFRLSDVKEAFTVSVHAKVLGRLIVI